MPVDFLEVNGYCINFFVFLCSFYFDFGFQRVDIVLTSSLEIVFYITTEIGSDGAFRRKLTG